MIHTSPKDRLMLCHLPIVQSARARFALVELSHEVYQAILDQYCSSTDSTLLILYPTLQVKNQTDGYHVLPRLENSPQVLD